MAGEVNKVDTGLLVNAAGEIGTIKKNISSSTESAYAVLRKMLETNEGAGADELGAIAGQLKKSSADIIKTLAQYETVLKELAGIYDKTESNTTNAASKLKFGGLR